MYHTGSIRAAAFRTWCHYPHEKNHAKLWGGRYAENIQVKWPTRICTLAVWQEGVGERVGAG